MYDHSLGTTLVYFIGDAWLKNTMLVTEGKGRRKVYQASMYIFSIITTNEIKDILVLKNF